MRDPLAYRDRFPILGTCTCLINHSLAAMPARAEVVLSCFRGTGTRNRVVYEEASFPSVRE